MISTFMATCNFYDLLNVRTSDLYRIVPELEKIDQHIGNIDLGLCLACGKNFREDDQRPTTKIIIKVKKLPFVERISHCGTGDNCSSLVIDSGA